MAALDVDSIGPEPAHRSSPSSPAQGALLAAPALVILGIISVQLGSALAKHLFDEVGSFGSVALRLTFAASVLLAFWRPTLRLDRRAWTAVVAYGVVLGLMNLSYYLSLARLPLGIAVSVGFLGPLAVALIGSRRWLDVALAVLAAAGVFLLMEGGGELDLLGFVFALASGMCWGLYILVGARLGRQTATGKGLALAMVVAALVTVPVGVVDAGAAVLQPWVLLTGMAVAMLSSVIPYSVDLEALRRMPPRVFGILMSLEPAMAALVGLVVLGESLHRSQWIAVGCVVLASVGATRRQDAG